MKLIYPKYNRIELAIGGANKRGKIVTLTEAVAPIDAIDCFTTMFRFDKAFATYVKETGSVKSYNGPCWCDWLWYDIDAPILNEAVSTLMELIKRLKSIDSKLPEILRIYFSGAKGFHCGIPIAALDNKLKPSNNFAQTMRSIARKIAHGIKYDDIYNTTRLWRMPNTINGKTGLRKVLVSLEDVLQ